MTGVVLATTDPAFEHRVREALESSNGDVRLLGPELTSLPPQQAVSAVTLQGTATPDVVALGPGIDLDAALAVARRFDELHPEVNILLVAPRSAELLEAALRAGVRDVIDPDGPDGDLRSALQRATATAARRRSNLAGDTPGQSRRVITVISPKGGSGKTTVVTNLAVGLAQKMAEQVVLLDLDLTFGDVSASLGLVPQHTISHVRASLDDLDTLELKGLLTSHPSGLYALCAPDSPAEGERMTSSGTAQILQLLASQFRHVVVDTSAGLDDHSLTALELSTDVLLVCTMDVPSIRSLHKVVTALDQLGMTTQRRHFVLNRAESRVGLDAADIERTVGLPVSVAIPSSRSVPLSMNQGLPVLTTEPRSVVARRMQQLVDLFAPAPITHRAPGKLWRRA